MASIFPGRYAAQSDGPFVVFLIGMRINRLWALHQWPRVAAAMPPMIKELKRDPALGLLRAEFNRRIGGNGSVGIWHETYTVGPGQYETINANMLRFGLGGAVQHMPATGRLENARSRIGVAKGGESSPDQNV